jgi:hypothetical protein
MTGIRRLLPRLLAFLMGMIVLAVDARPARAQYGMGMGMGWGWGGFGAMPSPSTTLLNDHAIARTGAAAARQPGRSHSPYGNNPNAYFNRIRDNGFVSHSDVGRRRPPTYRPERAASLGNSGRAGAQPEAAAVPARSVVPLEHFFDASLRLVWPLESPSAGDLKQKREISDGASLAVLKETRQQGSASLTSVTEARSRLLDYGRLALQEIRAQATPPIADSFHQFMLSLYDSLAEAASTPGPGR